MLNFYEILANLQNANTDAAVCTVVNTRGSTPRCTGAKMIVLGDGSIQGTIGGGDLEKKVIENAVELIKAKAPKLFRHDLVYQHNMCCGGTVEIFIEPVMKKNRLYIFGAGHVGQALACYAKDMQFEVVLIDDRKEYLDATKDPSVSRMHLPFSQALQLLPFDDHTYICIMTYDHNTDRDILSFCIKKPHAYLGMIGSRRKVEMTKKKFEDATIANKEELSDVDMPMGLDINAEGPNEIAISILAGLIKVKNLEYNAK
jgi:xanthine dehydrogenase accessory factor